MAAKLMEMNKSKGAPGGLPFDIEGPGESMGSMKESAGGGQIPGYVGPWEHCAACEYFDGQKSMCKKFNAPCDMDGGCPAFEAAGEGGSMDEEGVEMMGEGDDE